jgi:hypothetical protein
MPSKGNVTSAGREVTKQRQRIAENQPQQATWPHGRGTDLEMSSLHYQFGEFTLRVDRGRRIARDPCRITRSEWLDDPFT